MATIAVQPPRIGEAQERPDGLALTYHRLMLVMLLFLGVSTLIVGRLLYLQVFTDRSGAAQIGNPLVPPRADIVDRNGVTLARTIDAWSIGVHPRRLLGEPADLALKLAQLMPERSPAYYREMLSRDVNFLYLSRRAMPELVAAVNALGEPAIVFAREPERLYPQTQLAGHVLGWTDFDGAGVTGIERALEQRLTDPGTRGQALALSIDSRVQAVMEAELGAQVDKHSAEGGTGIVLDVRTGELMALASFPTFNPNAPGRVDPDAQYNRATMGVYELGSTFKPLTVAAALDAGTIRTLTQRYDASSGLPIGRFRISDYRGKGRPLNVPETLVHSSNIATARIADELGLERLQASFRALGFDTAPPLEIAERSRPLWPREWSRATLLTSSYGHGLAITPLQLATAYGALVNGGVWRPATLLKQDGAPPEGRRVYSAETSFQLRQMLRLVVMHGSGKRGDAAGFRVGGKTGTAEKITVGGGYSRKVNVSTFAAAFPMDDPRYVVIVMLDAPKATADTFGYTTAGWVSAPVVNRIVARAGPLLGVIPDARRDIDVAALLPLIGAQAR